MTGDTAAPYLVAFIVCPPSTSAQVSNSGLYSKMLLETMSLHPPINVYTCIHVFIINIIDKPLSEFPIKFDICFSQKILKNHFSHKGLFGSQTNCFMANPSLSDYKMTSTHTLIWDIICPFSKGFYSLNKRV